MLFTHKKILQTLNGILEMNIFAIILRKLNGKLKIAWENKYEFCNSYLKHIFYTKYNVAIFHLIKGGS